MMKNTQFTNKYSQDDLELTLKEYIANTVDKLDSRVYYLLYDYKHFTSGAIEDFSLFLKRLIGFLGEKEIMEKFRSTSGICDNEMKMLLSLFEFFYDLKEDKYKAQIDLEECDSCVMDADKVQILTKEWLQSLLQLKHERKRYGHEWVSLGADWMTEVNAAPQR